MKNDYYMNPWTGTVQTHEEWEAAYRAATPEEWGGPVFDDAGLVLVIPDGHGGWIEK